MVEKRKERDMRTRDIRQRRSGYHGGGKEWVERGRVGGLGVNRGLVPVILVWKPIEGQRTRGEESHSINPLRHKSLELEHVRAPTRHGYVTKKCE